MDITNSVFAQQGRYFCKIIPRGAQRSHLSSFLLYNDRGGTKYFYSNEARQKFRYNRNSCYELEISINNTRRASALQRIIISAVKLSSNQNVKLNSVGFTTFKRTNILWSYVISMNRISPYAFFSMRVLYCIRIYFKSLGYSELSISILLSRTPIHFHIMQQLNKNVQ